MSSKNKPAVSTRATAPTVKAARSNDDLQGTVQGINVRSFTPTFRRAGIEFTREGQDFRLDDLSKAQVEAIAAESMLSIRGIELAPLPDGGTASDAEGHTDTEAGNA